MLLRDVEMSDVGAYLRMRCDPVMMAELGGPLPAEGMRAKVERDMRAVATGTAWITMIVPDPAAPTMVAGTVTIWSYDHDGEPMSEIGWMVLPEFQGRGFATRAVRALLERARTENRWGVVHAFPATTNTASNRLCRSVGFTLLGAEEISFAGRILRSNHWRIDPRTDLKV